MIKFKQLNLTDKKHSGQKGRMDKKNLLIALMLAVAGILITIMSTDLVGDQYKTIISQIPPMLIAIIVILMLTIIAVLLVYVLLDQSEHQTSKAPLKNKLNISKTHKKVLKKLNTKQIEYLRTFVIKERKKLAPPKENLDITILLDSGILNKYPQYQDFIFMNDIVFEYLKNDPTYLNKI